jgi:putative acetyltransferase
MSADQSAAGGIRVRAESPRDRSGVRDVLVGAFPTPAEADLVDSLRGRTQPQIALVAEQGAGRVVGHVLFTPVEILPDSGPSQVLGLAPLAVAPGFQRRGVGAALVEAGLAACRAAGARAVVVLGHPAYYPRFGFRPAWDLGLYYVMRGPNPAFRVRELEPGALRGRAGEVRYHAAFAAL